MLRELVDEGEGDMGESQDERALRILHEDSLTGLVEQLNRMLEDWRFNAWRPLVILRHHAAAIQKRYGETEANQKCEKQNTMSG